MYELIRETRDCLCIEYSGSGPSGVWMLTAKPLKQGMAEDWFRKAGDAKILLRSGHLEACGARQSCEQCGQLDCYCTSLGKLGIHSQELFKVKVVVASRTLVASKFGLDFIR